MSQSRNWTAYYSGDFTQYDLTIEGEVQAHKILDVMLGLKEASSPPINPLFFHVELINASDGEYKKVKEEFKVEKENIEKVIVFNDKGQEEAKIIITRKEDK